MAHTDVLLVGFGGVASLCPSPAGWRCHAGADSTAVILSWIHEPGSRDFDLRELAILTTHTDDEWPTTGRDCEQVMLPLFAKHGVCYIQLARSQSNTPRRRRCARPQRYPPPAQAAHVVCVLAVRRALFAATVPQLGAHRCSSRSRAAVLEPIIATITAGRPSPFT
jgi:hypothetical protein